jgi:PhnB protein
MTFYAACLGGELTFQTIGESPMAENMPPKMKDSILHATLINGGVIIMASDMACEDGIVKGNTISLMLHCSSEEEIKSCYAKLSADGKANHPLEDTFWGAVFGDLTDKFGNRWLLSYTKNTNH